MTDQTQRCGCVQKWNAVDCYTPEGIDDSQCCFPAALADAEKLREGVKAIRAEIPLWDEAAHRAQTVDEVNKIAGIIQGLTIAVRVLGVPPEER